jgi:hypothetical protein
MNRYAFYQIFTTSKKKVKKEDIIQLKVYDYSATKSSNYHLVGSMNKDSREVNGQSYPFLCNYFFGEITSLD